MSTSTSFGHGTSSKWYVAEVTEKMNILMEPFNTCGVIITQSFRGEDFGVILNLLSISVPSTPWFTDILLYFCTKSTW